MATDVFFPKQEHRRVNLQPCNYKVLQLELAEILNPQRLNTQPLQISTAPLTSEDYLHGGG